MKPWASVVRLGVAATALALTAVGAQPPLFAAAPASFAVGSTPTPGPNGGDAEPAAAIPIDLPLRMDPDARSGAVRALQVRLRHARVLPTYNVDGVFGPQTAAAVRNFQKRNGLPASGVVDAATWAALRARTPTPTAAELANRDVGPWFVSPARHGFMLELQHRLAQAGVYGGAINGVFDAATGAAIAAYRQRIGLPASDVMDERTWTRLLAATRYAGYAELFDGPPPSSAGATQALDPRCLLGKVVCISKGEKTLSYVVDGRVRLTRAARFARPGYDSPEGEFRIWYKNRDTISRIFGERFPMPYAFFYDGNVAVHFSDDFALNGYANGSHGCSQLGDWRAAKWLYEQVEVGDKVVVYE